MLFSENGTNGQDDFGRHVVNECFFESKSVSIHKAENGWVAFLYEPPTKDKGAAFAAADHFAKSFL